ERRRRPPAAGEPRKGPAARPGAGAAAGSAGRPALGAVVVERRPTIRRLWDGASGRPRELACPPPRGAGFSCRGAPRHRNLKRPHMADLIRVMPHHEVSDPDSDPHLRQEWLVTNGLGGYASGTVTGSITRRYHGLLISALPNPLGRMMMLNG